MKVPSVSIIVPLYNKEREVAQALKSVFSQTITDFEIIVVNDGSTDKGPEIVRSISDPRIRVIDQANAGVSAARNRGIEESQSDLIAFLDADDEWETDFLETVIYLKKSYPSSEVFATNYSFRSANNKKRSTIIRGLPRGFKEGILKDYFAIASKSDPPLWSSAVSVTKSAIESVGGFPLGVVAGEDLLTWARLAVRYDIAYRIEPKAYHCEPIDLSNRLGRVPNVPDIVSQGLQYLLKTSESSKSAGLANYIALWHRMRASSYIRLGNRMKALQEIRKALNFSGFNMKLFAYSIIAILPKRFSKEFLKFVRSSLHRYVTTFILFMVGSVNLYF